MSAKATQFASGIKALSNTTRGRPYSQKWPSDNVVLRNTGVPTPNDIHSRHKMSGEANTDIRLDDYKNWRNWNDALISLAID